MLKYILTASVLAIATPALAQTAKTPASPPPAATQDSASVPAAADQATAPAASAAQTDPGATAATQPASADPVAQVVDQGWSTYDTNGDGKLSETEFAAWMNKVKSDSDPKLDPNAPATKKWNEAAFAQADTNKNKSVSKPELVAFLEKGQHAS